MSNKVAPYTSLLQKLILAHIDWNNEQHGRCDVLIDADQGDDAVLKQYSTNGQIVLNLGGNATGRLSFLDDGIGASLSFGGRQSSVFFRYDQIVGIRDFNGNLHAVATQLVIGAIGLMPINICPMVAERKAAEENLASTPLEEDKDLAAVPKPNGRPMLKVVK